MLSDRDLYDLNLADLLRVLDDISVEAEVGERFPSAIHIWLGCAVYGGTVNGDARQLLKNLTAENQPNCVGIRESLQTYVLSPTRRTALALVEAVSQAGHDALLLVRARFYAVVHGATEQAYGVDAAFFHGHTRTVFEAYRHGAARHPWTRKGPGPDAMLQRQLIHDGIGDIVSNLAPIGILSEAIRKHENPPETKRARGVEQLPEDWHPENQLLADVLAAGSMEAKAAEWAPEDLAAIPTREALIHEAVANGMSLTDACAAYPAEHDFIVPDPTDEEQLQIDMDLEFEAELDLQALAEKDEIRNSKLVIANLLDEGDRDRKAFLKSFKQISNDRTMMVRYEYPDPIDRLRQSWPHATDIIDTMSRDLVLGRFVQLRPTLLVGAPGSGKTTLLREFVNALQLPQIVYPCASVSDGSFGGTPAQWSSRRASTPLELIRTSLTANPVVILDELEKTGSNGHNGSLVHSLLPLLERHSAASYFETALETNADLSGVNFLATANSLDIPETLKDRFRIVRMPDPEPQHIGVLSRRIIAGIAADRSIDPAWIPQLDPDEIEVIEKAWGGGSLRKLKVAIEATVDVRDSVMVRQ